MTANTSRPWRFKNPARTAVVLIVIGLLAWLSNRYSVQIDITRNAANTLSSASQKLLRSLPAQIHVTAFIKKGQPLRLQIAQLLERYQRYRPDLEFTFIDPDLHPEQVKALNIGPEGAIVVEYQGRTEKLTFVDESSLTNTLLQLASAQERWVTFLSGHGERSPDGIANFDLGQFSKELSLRKINTQAINLTTIPAIPDNTALLVITPPAVPFMEGELNIIRQYLEQGGNLLLMTDPDDKHLAALEPILGFRRVPGMIADDGAKFYKLKDPAFVVINTYHQHAITQGFKTITLYPLAAALTIDRDSRFQSQSLWVTSEASWNETAPLSGAAVFNPEQHESRAPLAFAYALTRTLKPGTEQRIVLVGDGDFLSNAYMGNVGNLDMGLRMINWLTHDDQFINIDPKTATDKSLQLTELTVAVLGFGLLIFLPLSLLGTGFLIWRKRKRR